MSRGFGTPIPPVLRHRWIDTPWYEITALAANYHGDLELHCFGTLVPTSGRLTVLWYSQRNNTPRAVDSSFNRHSLCCSLMPSMIHRERGLGTRLSLLAIMWWTPVATLTASGYAYTYSDYQCDDCDGKLCQAYLPYLNMNHRYNYYRVWHDYYLRIIL